MNQAAAVLAFYAEESLIVHALCDRSGVPRTTPDGEMLSMSQRVAILQGVTAGLMKRIGAEPATTTH